MSKPIILAVDPGYMTGVAWFDGDEMHGAELQITESDTWLFKTITERKPTVVICEAFRITVNTAKNTQAPWSLELIGVTRLACRMAGITLAMQSPSTAKGFAKDDKLKALGWYTSTKGGHQNDAVRHLMVWLVEHGWWNPLLVKENR